MNAPKKVIQAQLLLLREESHRKLFIRIITPGTICTTENAILIYIAASPLQCAASGVLVAFHILRK